MTQENKNRLSIFYRLLIHIAGLIVPRDQRSDWKQEWNAELSHRVSLLQKWQSLNLRNRLDLIRRCRGAFQDAGVLQMYQLQEGFIKDIRYGARLLAKNIGFTSVAVLTLALAIGANTAIFSIAYRLLVNPLNIKDGDRTVYLFRQNAKMNGVTINPSFDLIDIWRQRSKSFDAVEIFSQQNFDITGQGEPESISAGMVAPTIFDFAGVLPIIGRPFGAEDIKPDASPTVILTDGLWKRRYGADKEIIGRQIQLADKSYTVIAVISSNFKLNEKKNDIWLPLSPTDQSNRKFVSSIAKLKSGVAVKQAQTEMDAISTQVSADDAQFKDWSAAIMRPQEYMGSQFTESLNILLAAVGFVLLIACANVTNLMLARNTVRAREVALRTALGAARIRLIRQLLTESVLLSAIGGILGIGLGYLGLSLIKTFGAGQFPQIEAASLNGIVLAFTLGITLLTGILCGIIPAIHASSPNLNELLKEGSKSTSGGLRHNRVRSVLTIAEIALSLVMLVAAGLMMRSFVRLQNVDYGFDATNILSIEPSLSETRYGSKQQQADFLRTVIDRIRRLPQVEAAEFTTGIPPRLGAALGQFEVEGQTPQPAPYFPAVYTGGDYFKVTKIPLREGRLFSDTDTVPGSRVAVLSEATAHRYWPNESPIGKRFRLSTKGDWTTVIGVVGSVKQTPASSGGDQGICLYFPINQVSGGISRIVIRTKINPYTVLGTIKEQIWALDKEMPINNITTVEKMMSETIADRRFNLVLMSIFTVIALVMASVGIFGVMSYSVNQRRQEIGIRVALGAQNSDIVKSILGQGFVLATIGIVVGLASSILFNRFLSNLLFGVGTTDAATLIIVSSVLLIVALLACYFPARRATKLDPIVALRCD